MPLWHLMTIIPHYHFLTLNCRKSLLGIVPSAWTPLWLIHHCVGDPNHPTNEEIGTTKGLALWREIALELMWRLRGIITVLPHVLIYLWVFWPFPGTLLNLLNLLLLRQHTECLEKVRARLCFLSMPLILDVRFFFFFKKSFSIQWLAIKVFFKVSNLSVEYTLMLLLPVEHLSTMPQTITAALGHTHTSIVLSKRYVISYGNVVITF